MPVVRVPVALALLATLVLTAGCLAEEPAEDGDDGDGGAAAQVHDVGMHNRVFDPSSLSVPKGHTLRFAAHDTMHSAGSTNGVYDAGDIPQGQSKDMLLDQAGTFTITCRFHPGMQMALTVTP